MLLKAENPAITKLKVDLENSMNQFDATAPKGNLKIGELVKFWYFSLFIGSPDTSCQKVLQFLHNNKDILCNFIMRTKVDLYKLMTQQLSNSRLKICLRKKDKLF